MSTMQGLSLLGLSLISLKSLRPNHMEGPGNTSSVVDGSHGKKANVLLKLRLVKKGCCPASCGLVNIVM